MITPPTLLAPPREPDPALTQWDFIANCMFCANCRLKGHYDGWHWLQLSESTRAEWLEKARAHFGEFVRTELEAKKIRDDDSIPF